MSLNAPQPLNSGPPDARGFKIGVVTARWNAHITDQLEAGALAELKKQGCTGIQAVRVPGAFEIPLAARALIEAGCDGVVALGCVIRGETTHYDYVCSSVERGCTELQLRTGRPVGFGILTTENEAQALDRIGGKHGHKGVECAQVVVEMIHLLSRIEHGARKEISFNG